MNNLPQRYYYQKIGRNLVKITDTWFADSDTYSYEAIVKSIRMVKRMPADQPTPGAYQLLLKKYTDALKYF